MWYVAILLLHDGSDLLTPGDLFTNRTSRRVQGAEFVFHAIHVGWCSMYDGDLLSFVFRSPFAGCGVHGVGAQGHRDVL